MSRAGGKTRSFLRETAAGPIVEFAIIVPVLLLLLFGIVDFARAFFQRNNLVAAAREGARLAAVQEFPCNGTVQSTILRPRVVAVLGTLPPGFDPNSDITFAGCSGTLITDLTVQIQNYPFIPVFGILGLGSLRLSAAATYRWERS
jgi:hypothetical protein